MKKYFFSAGMIVLLLSGILSAIPNPAQAGDNKKSPAVVAPPKDMKAELRKKDSTAYYNLDSDAGNYTFQDTPNEILLSNGIKLTMVKLKRFPIPRGVAVTIPDTITQRANYELAELELKATNTNSYDVKIDASEAVLVSVKLYSAENGFKAYTSQYSLSLGSVYLKTEPAQPEKMNTVYNTSTEFLHKPYKAGQTKSCSGLVIPIAKAVKTPDRIVIITKEFGQNKSYGCPLKL